MPPIFIHMKNNQNECFNFLSCDKEFFKFCGRIIGWSQLFLIFINFSFLFSNHIWVFSSSYLPLFYFGKLPLFLPCLNNLHVNKGDIRRSSSIITIFLVNNNHHNQNCNKSWTWLVITSPIWVLMGQWMCHVIGHCSN